MSFQTSKYKLSQFKSKGQDAQNLIAAFDVTFFLYASELFTKIELDLFSQKDSHISSLFSMENSIFFFNVTKPIHLVQKFPFPCRMEEMIIFLKMQRNTFSLCHDVFFRYICTFFFHMKILFSPHHNIFFNLPLCSANSSRVKKHSLKIEKIKIAEFF